jgi:hypothetical protein
MTFDFLKSHLDCRKDRAVRRNQLQAHGMLKGNAERDTGLRWRDGQGRGFSGEGRRPPAYN